MSKQNKKRAKKAAPQKVKPKGMKKELDQKDEEELFQRALNKVRKWYLAD